MDPTDLIIVWIIGGGTVIHSKWTERILGVVPATHGEHSTVHIVEVVPQISAVRYHQQCTLVQAHSSGGGKRISSSQQQQQLPPACLVPLPKFIIIRVLHQVRPNVRTASSSAFCGGRTVLHRTIAFHHCSSIPHLSMHTRDGTDALSKQIRVAMVGGMHRRTGPIFR